MKNRIKELRTAAGLSQERLAELMNSSQQHVQRMESGEQRLNTDHMEAFGHIFGVDPIEILVDLSATAGGGERAPLLDDIQAGAFAEAAADVERHQLVGADRWVSVNFRKPTKFGLEVSGDSMNRIVPEGGVVIVDYSVDWLENGELGVFRMEGKATFKRMRRDGAVEWLEPDSDNPRHASIFPEEGRDIEVIGRVVETYREPEIIEAPVAEPARRRTPRRAQTAAERS